LVSHLGEEFADEETLDVVHAQRGEQRVQRGEDGAPMLGEGGVGGPMARPLGGAVGAVAASSRAGGLGGYPSHKLQQG